MRGDRSLALPGPIALRRSADADDLASCYPTSGDATSQSRRNGEPAASSASEDGPDRGIDLGRERLTAVGGRSSPGRGYARPVRARVALASHPRRGRSRPSSRPASQSPRLTPSTSGGESEFASWAATRLARLRPCAAARRSARAVFAGTPGHALELLLASPRARPRPSRSGAAARAAAPGRRPRAGRTSTRARRASRRWRWKAIAKRCASSRIRCRSCSPGECAASTIGSGAARDEDLLHPLRERDHRDARQVVRLHRRERRRELALAAVDRRRGSAPPRTPRRTRPRVAGRASRANRRETTSAIAAKSSCPVEPAHGELAVVRLLRDRRPRTRPSSRRSPRPGCSRCRSTRSGSAGSRGSAPRAAPRAPRRGAAASSPTTSVSDASASRAFCRASSCSRRFSPRSARAHLDARAAQLRQELLERARGRRRPRGTTICGGIDGAEP